MGGRGAVLVLVASLAIASGAAALPPPETATQFADEVRAWRDATVRCYRPDRPASDVNLAALTPACEEAARIVWPEDPLRWAVVLVQLAWTEFGGRNGIAPKDPSCSYWGLTVPTARRFGAVLGYRMPSSDDGVVWALLARPREAAVIAAVVLRYHYDRERGSIERAVLRYKIGRGGNLRSRTAAVRLRHWRATARAYETAVRAYRAGQVPPCGRFYE